MATITLEQAAAAFDASRRVANGQLAHADAVTLIVSDYGMNRGSAANYLQSLRDMSEGRGFGRAINRAAADHFISRFFETGGIDSARQAVRSLREHIAGYEKIRNVTMQSLRELAKQWDAKLQLADDEADQPEFDQQVAAMLAASPSIRQANLPPAGHKPKQGYVTSKVFQRSAAVVAEVLLRANGFCESCKKPAPFLRAKDGFPFLEVHHKIQLAHGGDDTVHNAIAVCPNCHREHHFG